MTTLFKVMVPCGSQVLTSDGIEHEGKLWLVPMWLTNTVTKAQRPKLMIRFDCLPHQSVPTGLHSYLLNQQVPACALDGSDTTGFETLQGNEVAFEYLKDSDLH
jgi:hypothetical protein